MSLSPLFRTVAQYAAGNPAPPPPDVDWQSIVDQAIRARVGPMVLRTIHDLAPPAMVAQLEERACRIAFEGLRILQERDHVLQALQDATIGPVILLKGAVTGWLVYPDPIARAMTDVDILVPLAQEQATANTLVRLGYNPIDTHPNRPVSARVVYEHLFARELVPGRVLQPVDVHTGFAQPARYPVPYDAVIQRAIPFEEGGPGAYRLDDVDHLLHMAIHMSRDQFLGPLKHLLDVHLWVLRGGFCWDTLVERAQRWGAAGSLATTLRLSADVLGTPIPTRAVHALHPSGIRGRFLRWWHRPTEERMVRWDVGIRAAQIMALAPLMDQPTQRARFLSEYVWLRTRDVLGH